MRNHHPAPNLGQRVRARRTAVGLSQFELAARSGISIQTIGLVERAGFITQATAEKLAPVLKCEPGELLP